SACPSSSACSSAAGTKSACSSSSSWASSSWSTPSVPAYAAGWCEARTLEGRSAMNYSDSDRQRLLSAAAEVVLATMAADRTGPVAYVREMMAAGRYLYDAERQYAHNPLVQALLSGAHDPAPTEGEKKSLPRERLLE